MAAADAVRAEIIAVEGEDLAGLQALSRGDQGSVRQVHRVIGVLIHQSQGAGELRNIGLVHTHAALPQKDAQLDRAAAVPRQDVEHFGQDWPGRHQRRAKRFQAASAIVMVCVSRIKEGDEGP